MMNPISTAGLPVGAYCAIRGKHMKIVILERNSAGLDIPMDAFYKLGEVTEYPNTVADNVAERIKDAEIIVSNKVPLNEKSLKDAPDVKHALHHSAKKTAAGPPSFSSMSKK